VRCDADYRSNELRLLVRERAAEACEYCLIAEAYAFFPHEIDHITAQQHGGETVGGESGAGLLRLQQA
jgi:hypothetical protein